MTRVTALPWQGLLSRTVSPVSWRLSPLTMIPTRLIWDGHYVRITLKSWLPSDRWNLNLIWNQSISDTLRRGVSSTTLDPKCRKYPRRATKPAVALQPPSKQISWRQTNRNHTTTVKTLHSASMLLLALHVTPKSRTNS